MLDSLSFEDRQTIEAFHALYSGGVAQKRRDAGEPNAMPPWAEVYWMGKQVVKSPVDLWTYQEIIFETRPDIIVETGTSGGGSAWFFATLFDMMEVKVIGLGLGGCLKIITVDKDFYPELCLPHPRIQYLTGDSTSEEIAAQIRAACTGKRVMVSLDSLHTYEHVSKELALYGELVSPGCYLVVEDTGLGGRQADWCSRAAAEFVDAHPNFEVDHSREKHMLTSNWNGWIKRTS